MTSKPKKYIIGILILIVAIVIFIFSMQRWDEYKMEKRGNEVVSKVEQFRKDYGRLPESRGEMGLQDGETVQPYYIKRSDSSYEVYYTLGFDTGYIYRSDTQHWEDYP